MKHSCRDMGRRSRRAFIVLACSCFMAPVFGQPPVGFGTQTRGGLDGTVIRVTTLARSGAGSLGEAIGRSGKRVVVFEVGGVIDLAKGVYTISNPEITIAGQTAPPPGITIIRGGIEVKTRDVVIQHMSVRVGDAGAASGTWEPDGISVGKGNIYNVVIDHCSVTWGVDENLSVGDFHGNLLHDITLHKCIIASGLSYSVHPKGEHSMGTLLNHCDRITIIGCLYAHNRNRNPRLNPDATATVVNNVMYNTGAYCVHVQESSTSKVTLSVVGNVWIPGFNTINPVMISQGALYQTDNLISDRKSNFAGVVYRQSSVRLIAKAHQWPDGLNARPARDALVDVLTGAGARARERDRIDKAIVADVIAGTGKIINSQNEAGGYPSYAMTTRKLQVPPNDIGGWLRKMAAEVERDTSLDLGSLLATIGKGATAIVAPSGNTVIRQPGTNRSPIDMSGRRLPPVRRESSRIDVSTETKPTVRISR